jgi:hypothetical protein
VADASFHLKLRRAREHFGAFNEAAKWWLETEPYRVAQEIDAEADTKQVVVIADRQPPERLSLMLGDAIQNLRSSLDYLIGDLARASSSGYLMPSIERDLQFPITTKRASLKGAVRHQARLRLVPLRAGALIQKLQPYRRGQNPATHPLWILHQLSNIDKHRRIPLLMAVVSSVDYDSVRVGSVGSLTMGGTGPFKHKAILLAYSPANADVDVNLGSVRVDIALGEGLPAAGQPVAAVVPSLFNLIHEQVIRPLTAYL